jgi:Phage integrase family
MRTCCESASTAEQGSEQALPVVPAAPRRVGPQGRTPGASAAGAAARSAVAFTRTQVIGPKGGQLRRSNFRKFWHQARGAVGLPELHFHDLRHTGNTMAAAQGASLKELMERMDHSSPRAALIYLHATRERDQKIAAGMGKLFTEAKKTSTKKTGTSPKPSGTQRARAPKRAS